MDAYLLDTDMLAQLVERLRLEGEVIGPQIDRGVIAYGPLKSFEDLPQGWSELQGPGLYRLQRTGRPSRFAYRVAPTSWKPFLYPPKELLFRARKEGDSFTVQPAETSLEARVLFGLRPCELRALRVQERVLSKANYPPYQQRLQASWIVAVACVEPGENCFCADLDSGPEVRDDCDLKLVEWGDEPRYLAQAGSERGRALLRGLALPTASAEDQKEAQAALARARRQMGRSLDRRQTPDLLTRKHAHPAFDALAERCTACGNCTLVCPTCFCSNLEDHTSLDGREASRYRVWDSCFTLDFSYIHGGHARSKPSERYRQWMTHKLSSWQSQFDEAGCVGCGRCITWCPEGIDLTEEFRALTERAKESTIQYRELT
ncbi:MAG: 4Fe-4S dicluster domain-containing protein [bacterium]|nr:4Fe-4S dicluster domain-containing protein [bacterium]